MTIRQINIQTNVETTIPDNRVVSEEEVANGIRDERNEELRSNVETTIPDNRVVSEEEVANGIRDERNEQLRSTVDVIAGNVLRWNCLTTEEQALWTTYRLELLDVPQQAGFPNSVTWPTEPS